MRPALSVVAGRKFDNLNFLSSDRVIRPVTVCPHAVAVLDGKLYAVGGFNGDDFLNSVERHDPATNAWEAVAPLTLARFGAGVAALEGKLYAVGGRTSEEDDETEVDSHSVERFDPASNAWEEVAPMATARAFSFALLM